MNEHKKDSFALQDNEARLICVCPRCDMKFDKLIEPEPDLENCTIRELEMFKIGFAHGKRVTLTEMKRQMEEVLCEEK